MIMAIMLAGWIPSRVQDGVKEPLFLPDNEPLLVGVDLFRLLHGEQLVYEVISIGDLPQNAIRNLELGHPIFVRLLPFDMNLAKQIVKALPVGSAYFECQALGSYGFQEVASNRLSLKSCNESFGCFTADLTGIGKKPQKQIESIRNALTNELPDGTKEKEGSFTRPKWANIKVSLKRDGLNPLFAITFILLGLATELGYFFLGEDSSASFRVACIVMASIFPFMCCVPMGFLYQDRGCKKPSDSLFFMTALVLVSLLGFLCPIICLAVGNQFAWNGNDLILFSCLGLSSLLWIAIRIALNPLVSRFFKKKA